MYLRHFNLLIGYMFSLVLISLQISLLYYMIYFSASDLKFKEVFTETHMSAIPWSYSSNPPKSNSLQMNSIVRNLHFPKDKLT